MNLFNEKQLLIKKGHQLRLSISKGLILNPHFTL